MPLVASRLGSIAVLVCAGLLVTACEQDSVKDASDNVPFTPCSDAPCSGTLPSGAEFEILLPQDWAGSLAIYSQRADPIVPGAGRENERAGGGGKSGSEAADDASGSSARPAPRWEVGDQGIADLMLQAKYAIAGASPRDPGWSVAEQVTAATELHKYFVDKIATPNRVYAWGEGTGGLASASLAEQHPGWVSGAAAMCAPLSGPRPSFSLALDVAYAVRELLVDDLKLFDYQNPRQATQAFEEASLRVDRLQARGNRRDQARLIFIAGLANLPDHTRTEDGGDLSSRVDAYAAGIKRLLRQSTIDRHHLEQQVGGNTTGNAGTDYRQRLTAQQVATIEQLVPGEISDFYDAVKDGERVEADPEAELEVVSQGELTGDLQVPLLSLHNAYDPIHIAQHNSWYRVRVDEVSPRASANFVDLYALPPLSYSRQDPATEGAGNCVFHPRTVAGVMIQLNDWVRNGQYPGRDTVSKAFQGAQVSITYDPGPWPAMAITPRDEPLTR